jgi:hypothetical protein
MAHGRERRYSKKMPISIPFLLLSWLICFVEIAINFNILLPSPFHFGWNLQIQKIDNEMEFMQINSDFLYFSLSLAHTRSLTPSRAVHEAISFN